MYAGELVAGGATTANESALDNKTGLQLPASRSCETGANGGIFSVLSVMLFEQDK